VGILQEIGTEHYHADFNTALAKAVSLAEDASTL
jgi:SulP family sulfate permease